MSAAAPLARVRRAVLGWPGGAAAEHGLSMTLHAAGAGGHALLGRNGTGKTLIASALARGGDDDVAWVRQGELTRRDGWSSRSSSIVSFESHEALLEQGGSVYRALGIPPGTTPSKAAKFLLVRFGLHPLLYRPVNAISTGEIRKVLLARALASRPSLLVLDNAFDGLDVASRKALAELLSATLRGFSQLLVQGVDASATARTQVLLLTHRAEEIVDEVSTVSYFGQPLLAHPDAPEPQGVAAVARGGDELIPHGGSAQPGADRAEGGGALVTELRAGRSSRELMAAAMAAAAAAGGGEAAVPPALPSARDVAALWATRRRSDESDCACGAGISGGAAAASLLVEARGLRVSRGDAVPLAGLDWRVASGEHWLIAGGNGAGKSTLSRLLAMSAHTTTTQGVQGALTVLGTPLGSNGPVAVGYVAEEGTAPQGGSGRRRAAELSVHRPQVGWVSTELHMSLARSSAIAADVLASRHAGVSADARTAAANDAASRAVAEWLGLSRRQLARPFAQLSQGEQKLILIGAAIALRPRLLILDEPCQVPCLLTPRRLTATPRAVMSSHVPALPASRALRAARRGLRVSADLRPPLAR